MLSSDIVVGFALAVFTAALCCLNSWLEDHGILEAVFEEGGGTSGSIIGVEQRSAGVGLGSGIDLPSSGSGADAALTGG